MPREEKEARVREIAAQLKDAEAAVLTGYRGLTVQESGELRSALAEVDTRLSVIKNSLAMLAVRDAGFEGLTEMFDGPTAVAYVKGDAVAAAKRLVEQAKRFPVLEIRGGFAEGRILSAEQIRSLATLDTREVMLAKIAGLGKLQMARAAFMFQALQSKFLLLLQALREQLPEQPAAEVPEEAAETPADETPAQEPPAAETATEEAPAEPAAEESPAAEVQPDAEQPADTGEPESAPDEGGADKTATETTTTDETEPAAPAGESTEGEA